MSKAELDVLEQQVEIARKRVTDDLVRLRSPDTMSEFKNQLWAQAEKSKDELVQKVTGAASNGAQRALADLKTRVAEHPVATLAIGAGLAWRLARHPPIATLLVGVGLVSLFKTGTSNNGSSTILSQANELAGAVGTKVQRWGEEAREATQQAVSQISTTASNVAAQAANTASNVAMQAVNLPDRAFPEKDLRDAYLLGAAALAVGAATVISYQRRGS
jgi:hypothetical protein